VCRRFNCAWLLGQLSANDKPCKTTWVIWAAYINGVLTVFASYRRFHKKTFNWLMAESHKFPVVIRGELYVNGKEAHDRRPDH
jgi:hypothetical protein